MRHIHFFWLESNDTHHSDSEDNSDSQEMSYLSTGAYGAKFQTLAEYFGHENIGKKLIERAVKNGKILSSKRFKDIPTEIIFDSCRIGNLFIQPLADAIGSKKSSFKLRVLSLKDTQLKDKDIRLIVKSFLKSHVLGELTRICFLGCCLQDETLKILIKAIQKKALLQTLEQIDLSNNEIQKKGCFALAKLLASLKHSSKLSAINLFYNSIADEGAIALVKAVMSNPSLQLVLDLSYNPLSEAAYNQIYTLIENADLSVESSINFINQERFHKLNAHRRKLQCKIAICTGLHDRLGAQAAINEAYNDENGHAALKSVLRQVFIFANLTTPNPVCCGASLFSQRSGASDSERPEQRVTAGVL